MSEEIEGLKKTIAQKDEMINGDQLKSITINILIINDKIYHTAVMKTRTKEFVTKLKDEQAEQMAAFTTQMQQKEDRR